jgi:hypothetical protein
MVEPHVPNINVFSSKIGSTLPGYWLRHTNIRSQQSVSSLKILSRVQCGLSDDWVRVQWFFIILSILSYSLYQNGYVWSSIPSYWLVWLVNTYYLSLSWVVIIWLVVLTILKNMKVNGKVDILYMKSKIIQMFKTTNQDIFSANKNKTNRKISSHQTPGIPAV